MSSHRFIGLPTFFLTLALLAAPPTGAREAPRASTAKKPLELVDLMKFRTLEDPVISKDGTTLAYELRPDRGDGELVVETTDGESRRTLALGSKPVLSPDGRWAMAIVNPSLEAVEGAEDEPPEGGLALLEVPSGKVVTWSRVASSALTEDGRWLALLHTEKAREEVEKAREEALAQEESSASSSQPEAATETEAPEAGSAEAASTEKAAEKTSGKITEKTAEKAAEKTSEKTSETATEKAAEKTTEEAAEEADEKKEHLGTTLLLRRLEDGAELEIEHVTDYAFARTSGHLAYAVAAPEGANGLFVRDLELPLDAEPLAVTRAERGRYSALTWAHDAALLGFVAAVDDEDDEPGDGALWIWQASSGAGSAVVTRATPQGWFVPSINELRFSRDGERLFFGTKPRPEPKTSAADDIGKPFDPYDVETLVAKAELDVWHVDDPLIKPNERQQWKEEKDRTYRAVYHLQPGAGAANVQLADLAVRSVTPADNPRGVLGFAEEPYLRERSWAGFFFDVYWISLEDGSRQLVTKRQAGFQSDARLSPDGRYVAWYSDPHWYLFDSESGISRPLTTGLDVPFANEDHDYPSPRDSYGVAGWLDDSSAVLINDKYDVWSFPVDADSEVRSLTGGVGRAEQLSLRVVDQDTDEDPDVTVLASGSRILLHGYREKLKNDGFWELTAGDLTLRKLLEDEKQFRFVARAKEAEKLLITRESYREFPDLWVSDPDFATPRKLSNANPQIADYAWGNAELVHFTDADGRASDAVLIRPETLEDGERCPVLIYYYRFFSQRLFSFNEPKVNHRPSFPVYASHGYCVFLPDVRFEIGRPGLSAVKALVPAVQKIVDMGVADPNALGLHGHSWSGYQTAHVITQTDIFAAAVAGAPVSNMTSAYGGIRYGTGLSRQFQYESGQSRLGASLWEARDRYIENSPLFYADRIETPLLIEFGDEDEAVPWTQGIELYLALRRLGKDAVFLQYHGEPHHLKKYPNKLDYSIKMKEFFDHYLKGAPAPSWLTDGVPFRGEAEGK